MPFSCSPFSVPKNANNHHSDHRNRNAFPPEKPLPVMFWIFGGAFVLGDEQEFGLYNGNELASSQDVIIVAANYRVGAFGFLGHEALLDENSVENGGDGSTGNYGIQDQRMAMKWVQDNIAAFGGDPNDVSIFGQSAGAMSVCTHFANSEGNEGLFKNAIMESGTCDSPEFYQTLPDALEFGEEYSEIIGCPRADYSDNASFLKCLRTLRTGEIMYGLIKAWEENRHQADPNELAAFKEANATSQELAAAATLMNFVPVLGPLMPFGPVIDGTAAGMPKMPLDSIKAGEHCRDVNLMAGTTSNEGSLFIPVVPSWVPGISLPMDTDDVRPLMHHILDEVLTVQGVDDNYEELLSHYPLENYSNVDDQVAKIIRDYIFTCPTRRAIRAVASFEEVQTYLYQFDYKPDWLDFKIGGNYHLSELYFVFGNAWPTPFVHRFSKDDKEMVKIMGDYFANFAKNNVPTQDGGAEWPMYTIETDQHMNLDYPSDVRSNLNEATCDYHDELLGFNKF